MEITHEYSPYGAAKKLLECRDKEVVLSGSAGTGKSFACIQKVVLCMFKYVNARALMVRQTRESLTTTGVATLQNAVIPHLLEAGMIKYYGGSKRDPAQYIFPNGSSIMLGGLDRENKIMSSEYDLIFVQEAIELQESAWQKLTTRLRNYKMPYQQLIADTNPAGSSHWLKQRADRGVTTMFQSVHEDNPMLYDPATGKRTPEGEDYISTLDNLTGVEYDRLRLGLWVSAEGIIYDDFREDIHVIDDFEPPADWRRYWSIDFGYTNPFVCQMWAEDNDGRLYLYREIYQTQTIVEDHAKHIMSIVAPDGEWIEPKPSAVICDHDAEDRKTFTRHTGLRTKPAKKTVTTGIEAVKKRLRVAGDGKPRIFFMKNALVKADKYLKQARKPLSTVQEIPSYIWSDTKTDQGKDIPEKENDHGQDAERYIVAYKDLRALTKVA